MKKGFLLLCLIIVHLIACKSLDILTPELQKSFDQIFSYFLHVKDQQKNALEEELRQFDKNMRAVLDQQSIECLYHTSLSSIIRTRFSRSRCVDIPQIVRELQIVDTILKSLSCNADIYDNFLKQLKKELVKKQVDMPVEVFVKTVSVVRAPRPTPDNVSQEDVVGAHSYLPGLDQAVAAAVESTIAT